MSEIVLRISDWWCGGFRLRAPGRFVQTQEFRWTVRSCALSRTSHRRSDPQLGRCPLRGDGGIRCDSILRLRFRRQLGNDALQMESSPRNCFVNSLVVRSSLRTMVRLPAIVLR